MTECEHQNPSTKKKKTVKTETTNCSRKFARIDTDLYLNKQKVLELNVSKVFIHGIYNDNPPEFYRQCKHSTAREIHLLEENLIYIITLTNVSKPAIFTV